MTPTNEVLRKKLSRVISLDFSPSDFGKKENQNKILFHLERLSAVSKKVNHSPMSQMNDPSLAYISFVFKQQIDLSKNSFESGNKDFARFELLKTTNFCIECHTQTNKGPSFNSDLFKQNFSQDPGCTTGVYAGKISDSKRTKAYATQTLFCIGNSKSY